MTKALFLLALLFCTVSSRAYDSQVEGPGLAIDLISETRNVVPGKPFTVGLHIHHFAGFHTYWKNPGNVGVATSIEWTLPEGFTASEIAWPAPENTFMGQYPCHGYERDVTLLVTVTPPAEILEKTVTLTAKTMWMCCAKGCFPGYRTFTMTLPVAEKSRPDATARALITQARSEMPLDNGVTAKVLSEVDAKIIRVEFERKGKGFDSGDEGYFFSSDGQISSDKKQIFKKQDDGKWLLEIERSEFSPKGKKKLPGVLRIGKQCFSVNH